MKPLFTSLEELNNQTDLFFDPGRPTQENEGPFLVIKDDFYPDPDEVREIALKQDFFQYSPPLPDQVGNDVASKHPDQRPAWVSSSLLRYFGKDVMNPKPGFRYAHEEVRRRIAKFIGEKVTTETWDEMGDWWNGAFHAQYETWGVGKGAIHHHYKEGDVAPRGWSGLVYLTPNAAAEVGTTIWLEKSTGRCIATKGAKFEQDARKFELAFLVENKFNRLVLFRENVLHRAEHGFGTDLETARLTQTFFFHAERNASLDSVA